MKYNIIAIEREYASGGSEIGQRTARRLEIPCYGQEVLERAAELMNTVPEPIRISIEYLQQLSVFPEYGG